LEKKDITGLIAEYLTNQPGDSQLKILYDWIHANEKNRHYFDDMLRIWMAYAQKSFNKDAAYRLFLLRTVPKRKSGRANRSNSKSYVWIVRVVAAVFAGFVFGAFYVYQAVNKSVSPQAVLYNETIVPYGSRSLQVLADGTKVWLNAGSRLRHASDFGQTAREVYLEGEAYFDVAHDTAKAFIVKTDKVDIKALGTSFNVMAYPGEANIETVLMEGKISINDRIVLTPHEKGIYSRKNNQFTIEKKMPEKAPNHVTQAEPESLPVGQFANVTETSIDPAIYTSWKDELWHIESEALGSLAVKLERRYAVKIRFADRATQTLSINAVIKDESLEQVLRFLQLSAPIDFVIDGKSVVLKENKFLREKYKNYYKQN
jgi:ferric-dicitrate binding protein FerR (iron transport regulator)